MCVKALVLGLALLVTAQEGVSSQDNEVVNFDSPRKIGSVYLLPVFASLAEDQRNKEIIGNEIEENTRRNAPLFRVLYALAPPDYERTLYETPDKKFSRHKRSPGGGGGCSKCGYTSLGGHGGGGHTGGGGGGFGGGGGGGGGGGSSGSWSKSSASSSSGSYGSGYGGGKGYGK